MYKKISQLLDILSFLMEVLLVLLILRIVFRVVGVTSVTPFLTQIFLITNVLVAPFSQILKNPVIENNYIFDITAVLALGAYSFIYYVFLLVVKKVKKQKLSDGIIEGEIVSERITPAY